jgi:hypothetical protein
MPYTPSNSLATAGTISNWVLYNQGRGKSREDMVALSREYGKGYAWQSIYSLDRFWRGVKQFASRFNTMSPNTPLSRLNIPSQTGGTDALRVGVVVTFTVNFGKRIQKGKEYSTTVDASFSGNVQQVRQAVFDAALREINAKYGTRILASEGKVFMTINGIISL